MSEIQTEQKLPFDERFQSTLLELVLSDRIVAEKAYDFLTPELFSSEYFATLFDILLQQHKKNPFPSKHQLKNELAKIVDPKKSQMLLLIYKKITEPTDFRDYDYVKDNLEVYFRKRTLNKMVNDYIKNQNLHPDKQEEIIMGHLKKIESINFKQLKTSNLNNILGFLDECKDDAAKLIPTFLPTIDSALGGGVPRGTMSLTIGGTNVGKSIWLINWTYHLLMNGYKVLYINLEGYEKQVKQRMISRALRIPTHLVKRNMLTDYQREQAIAFQNKIDGKFEFFHNDSFDMSIETLLPAIIHMKNHVFDFDVLMVDYGQILKTKKNLGDLRHEQAYCHRALTSLASALDIHVATVAQGQRDTNTKNTSGSSLVRMTDISECFEINRAAATVFTLNRSERDEELQLIKILMDKQRDGKKGIVEFAKTDFDTVAMWGHESEGLGFINQQSYLSQSGQKAV